MEPKAGLIYRAVSQNRSGPAHSGSGEIQDGCLGLPQALSTEARDWKLRLIKTKKREESFSALAEGCEF